MSENQPAPAGDAHVRAPARWRKRDSGWVTADDRARVFPYGREWTVWTVNASGGVFPSLREAQRAAERWVAIADGRYPWIYVLACDEWPAVWWSDHNASSGGIDGYLRTADGLHAIQLWLEPYVKGWVASVLVRERGQWRMARHRPQPTARMALRELRRNLGRAIQAAVRVALDQPVINWRQIEHLSCVAQEWAPDVMP